MLMLTLRPTLMLNAGVDAGVDVDANVDIDGDDDVIGDVDVIANVDIDADDDVIADVEIRDVRMYVRGLVTTAATGSLGCSFYYIISTKVGCSAASEQLYH